MAEITEKKAAVNSYFNQPIWLHSRWSIVLSISVVAATIFSRIGCFVRSVGLCLLVGASVLAFLAATGSASVRITRSDTKQFLPLTTVAYSFYSVYSFGNHKEYTDNLAGLQVMTTSEIK